MQSKIYTFILMLITTGFINAQEISESAISMSLGKQNAFSVDIDGADDKKASKIWKDLVEDYGKVKKNKKAKEYYSMDVSIPMINGSKPMDMYIKFDERVNMTTATLWVDLGGGFADSNENPKEVQGIEEFMTNYYYTVRKSVIEEEMEEQEKELKKLDEDLEKLEKKNKDYHEDIEKAKKKIVEAEENIEKNLREQEDQRILIEQQKKVIEEIIERLNNLGKQ